MPRAAASRSRSTRRRRPCPARPICRPAATRADRRTDDNTSDTTPTFTGTATTGATVTIRDGATPVGAARLPLPVPHDNDVDHWATARTRSRRSASSTAGATSARDCALSVVIDTVAPTPTSVAALANNNGAVASRRHRDHRLLGGAPSLLPCAAPGPRTGPTKVDRRQQRRVIVTITDSGANDGARR